MVHGDAAEDLHVEMPLADRAHRRLAHQGIGLGHDAGPAARGFWPDSAATGSVSAIRRRRVLLQFRLECRDRRQQPGPFRESAADRPVRRTGHGAGDIAQQRIHRRTMGRKIGCHARALSVSGVRPEQRFPRRKPFHRPAQSRPGNVVRREPPAPSMIRDGTGKRRAGSREQGTESRGQRAGGGEQGAGGGDSSSCFGRFLFRPRTRTIPTPRWHEIHPDRDGLGTLPGSLISCRPSQNPEQKQHKCRYDPFSQTAQPRRGVGKTRPSADCGSLLYSIGLTTPLDVRWPARLRAAVQIGSAALRSVRYARRFAPRSEPQGRRQANRLTWRLRPPRSANTPDRDDACIGRPAVGKWHPRQVISPQNNSAQETQF